MLHELPSGGGEALLLPLVEFRGVNQIGIQTADRDGLFRSFLVRGLEQKQGAADTVFRDGVTAVLESVPVNVVGRGRV